MNKMFLIVLLFVFVSIVWYVLEEDNNNNYRF